MKKVSLVLFCIFTFIQVQNCFAQSQPPGVVISHLPANGEKYIGSPSICILPNGNYVASHDEFGPKSSEYKAAVTRIFSSSDKGSSWKEISKITGLFWSKIFVHNGELYHLGAKRHFGNVLIRRSTDGGKTWTIPSDRKSGLLLEGEYQTSPTSVIVHGGRIWHSIDYVSSPGGEWGKFSPVMISAPVDADLLDAENWTRSNPLAFDTSWLGGKFQTWLTGNAVVSPEGKMLNYLRIFLEEGIGEFAAVAKVSGDGKTSSFDPTSDFVQFPGGAKKVVIMYDQPTKRYWTLNNIVKSQHKDVRPGSVRNTLAISSSTDLRTWEVHEILLSHPDLKNHGFQYSDWQFEGNDIVFVSRTAYDDETGIAANYHDANYLTFHRITNFRRLVEKEVNF